VQKIVQDHGGQVTMERNAQKQTVFRITIPGRAPQDALNTEEDEGTGHSYLPVDSDRATETSSRHSDT